MRIPRSKVRIIVAFSEADEVVTGKSLLARAGVKWGSAISENVAAGHMNKIMGSRASRYSLTEPGKHLRKSYLAELSNK